MSYYTSSSSSPRLSKKGETPLMLGQGGSSLSWCPSLNIYRVNRFNILTNDKPSNKRFESPWISNDSGQYRRFDLIEELLMHNLVHVAEMIFDYIGFPYAWSCLRVCRLWYEFLAHHHFPRWADRMISHDASLHDIYAADELRSLNPGKICWQVHQLRQVWQSQRPKLKRLSCDSFVLSIKVHQERHLYCGLNNGSLQLWDLASTSTDDGKVTEKEDVHDKGIKSLDVNDDFIVTGSYDCTAKVWLKHGLVDWSVMHVINLHNDSVWDLRLKDDILVTGGLDGAIGIFSIDRQGVQVRNFFKATEALVAAVDFDDNILITGFEDTEIAIWTLHDAQLLRRIGGHSGGITGIRIHGNLFASCSYDGTVRLWSLDGEAIAILDEPTHLLRCIGFAGNTIISGDFGGCLHLWDVDLSKVSVGEPVRIKKYRHVQSHKSHIVCLQVSAKRIVSGSRDKTVLIQDFWASVGSQRSSSTSRRW